jgi:hypothetical protein
MIDENNFKSQFDQSIDNCGTTLFVFLLSPSHTHQSLVAVCKTMSINQYHSNLLSQMFFVDEKFEDIECLSQSITSFQQY